MVDIFIQFFNSVQLFFVDIGLFFGNIWGFFNTGIYDFFVEWFASFVIWSTIAMLKFKLLTIVFAWQVAQQILTQLNITSALAAVWSSLDSQLLNALTFFHFPEAVNIILSAHVTRFVLNFMRL